MINAVIFDFDMTLVDSVKAITRGLNKMATQFNLPPVTESDTRRVISLESKELWRSLWGRIDPAWNSYFLEHVAGDDKDYLCVIPGAVELLTKLKKSGRALGLATNRTRAWTALTTVGLASYFDTAVGVADVARGKPAPDMLYLAMQQLDSDPAQTILIGDAAFDMEAAGKAGIRGVGILDGGTPAEVLRSAGAWQLRTSLVDMYDILDMN